MGAFSSKSCGLHFYAQFTGGQNLKKHQQSLFKTDHSTSKGRPQPQMRTAKPPPNQLHHRPKPPPVSSAPSVPVMCPFSTQTNTTQICKGKVRGMPQVGPMTRSHSNSEFDSTFPVCPKVDTNENSKLCFPKLKAKTEQWVRSHLPTPHTA